MSDPTNEPSREPIREPTKRMDLGAELPTNLSPKKPREVDSKPKQDAELPSNIASTQPHGPCHDKKSERDGNGASTQSRGLCHDKKSKQVTFNKQEKDAVLLYNFWSKHTQHSNHYKEEPLQKHCCTNLGIQSKLIFTSEKTKGCQQLTQSANSKGGRLASLLLSGHKSVGSQPTSLCLMNNSRQSRSFIDDVSIDLWQCQLEIDKVKSKKTKNEPIASHSTIQSEPIASRSANQIKRDESSATFKLVVASVSKNYASSFDDKSSTTLKLVVASVRFERPNK